MLLLIVIATPVTKWIAHGLAQGGLNDQIQGDVLVVLSGSNAQVGGVMGYSTYVRAEYALWYFRRSGAYREIVILGGGGTPPVAESMKEFLVANGIPASSIMVETRSLSTRENALFSRDLLNGIPGRKVLLTSDYHLYRAKRVFRKAGIDVIPRALPDGLKSGSSIASRPTAAVTEALELTKIVYYYARGWM